MREADVVVLGSGAAGPGPVPRWDRVSPGVMRLGVTPWQARPEYLAATDQKRINLVLIISVG
jgi:hypothetical protein